MLSKKLITIAAAVALAIGNVSAESQGLKLHVHVRHADNTTTAPPANPSTVSIEVEVDDSSDDLCSGEGESPMSVEGVEGVFCVTGQACVADIDGACPASQSGLEYGSYCGTVKTGVMGCKPHTKETRDAWESELAQGVCTGENVSPMSVEGVEGIFCVEGQACVAEIDGACPGPQAGLEYGSSCGRVITGVMGCKPNSAPVEEEEEDAVVVVEEEDVEDEEEELAAPVECTGDNVSPMSVEGVEGIFCVSGQACVADIADGACPEAQEGLEFGAYCGKVKTGVYGCKPHTEETLTAEESEDEEEEAAPAECTGDNVSPMSVEGVEGVFCVEGQACVAEIDGACPGPQDGLELGSYCGRVVTGVMGCKPNSEESLAAQKAAKHFKKIHAKKVNKKVVKKSQPKVTTKKAHSKVAIKKTHAKVTTKKSHPKKVTNKKTTKHTFTKVHKKDNHVCSGAGESPMSVEGVQGVFCVVGQACVANIDGACPTAQWNLPYGSYCDTVKTGVKGCKPHTKESLGAWESEVATVCTGDNVSPMSVEGVEGIFCVQGQACVAEIEGACPGPQHGLEHGSYCGRVVTGVLGCKPHNTATLAAQKAAKLHKKNLHAKKHAKKSVKKVTKKEQHKKVTHKKH